MDGLGWFVRCGYHLFLSFKKTFIMIINAFSLSSLCIIVAPISISLLTIFKYHCSCYMSVKSERPYAESIEGIIVCQNSA